METSTYGADLKRKKDGVWDTVKLKSLNFWMQYSICTAFL